ncbi:hypothetical protein ACFYT4_28480 [Streptomyces sp. NPDC004609]|uniref:hypothetical protein n=1 Tax=Streptomyces sp. NPDC004609 TaxID=3364704 RepID=UPI0036AFD2D2
MGRDRHGAAASFVLVVLVTDYSGRVVGTVPDLPQVWGLELSEDSETVYAALSYGSAVVAIDTETLKESARHPTGAGTYPRYPALADDTLWFGYRIGRHGGIGSIDLSGEDDPAVRLNLTGPERGYAPLVEVAPEAGTLTLANTVVSGIHVGTYRTKGGTLRPQASRDVDAGPPRDIALSPDGDQVVLASLFPHRHQVFRTSDLAEENSYPTGYRPIAVDIAPDGTVAAGADSQASPDVYVFRPGSTTPIRAYDFGKADTFGNNRVVSPALAWAPDRRHLFTVTGDGLDKGLALQVMVAPTRPAPGTPAPAERPERDTERADRAGSAPHQR